MDEETKKKVFQLLQKACFGEYGLHFGRIQVCKHLNIPVSSEEIVVLFGIGHTLDLYKEIFLGHLIAITDFLIYIFYHISIRRFPNLFF